VGGQQEVDRLVVLVDGPIEVAPLAADLDVSLIDPDRGGLVCLNSELGLDEWISCRVQAATGCGSLSK